MVFETTAYADSAIKPAGSFYQQTSEDSFTAAGRAFGGCFSPV
jgi:hypothetical protein